MSHWASVAIMRLPTMHTSGCIAWVLYFSMLSAVHGPLQEPSRQAQETVGLEQEQALLGNVLRWPSKGMGSVSGLLHLSMG